MKEIPTIQTERLVLRPFEPGDAEDIRRLAGAREIADTTLNIPHPYPRGGAEEWIAKHRSGFQSGEGVVFAVTIRDSGELAGTIGMKIEERYDRAELIYWIGHPYWGRGFCTEAGEAILEFGFIVLKLNRITSSHFRRNPASGRVLEKLGLVREGLARRHVKKWDRYEDLVLYGILKSEWESSVAHPAVHSFDHPAEAS